MNAIAKRTAASLLAALTSFASTGTHAWWNDDDHYDRWYGGRWYGYPGYAWGGCPGYGWGYPGYGWGGSPSCYGWGGYPGYGQIRTIIVNPQVGESPRSPVAEPPK